MESCSKISMCISMVIRQSLAEILAAEISSAISLLATANSTEVSSGDYKEDLAARLTMRLA